MFVHCARDNHGSSNPDRFLLLVHLSETTKVGAETGDAGDDFDDEEY